jgi:hypothetical protein
MPKFNRFDVMAAWFLYAAAYHGGQYTKLYRVFARLDKVGFQPSFLMGEAWLNNPENENVRAIYQSLVERKVHQ